MRDEKSGDHRYDDIIDLPHPTSKRHPRMPVPNRAAQFAPFAALTGFEGVIEETGRLTDRFIPLDEDQKEEIDLRLELLRDRLAERPEVSFVYFVQDTRKEGGSYLTASGCVKKIDDIERVITLTDGTRISIDFLFSVSGDIFREFFPEA